MKGKAENIGMKRLCGILLALLLLLGACSGEESKSGLPQENIPIGFSGVITTTRGIGEFATADDGSVCIFYTWKIRQEYCHTEFYV